MNFHVGQKVVCVEDSPIEGLDGEPEHLLQRGDVYTVTSIQKEFGLYQGEGRVRTTLSLAEVRNHWTTGFNSARFRPVAYPKQSESTDVALFTHHLTPTDQPVDA